MRATRRWRVHVEEYLVSMGVGVGLPNRTGVASKKAINRAEPKEARAQDNQPYDADESGPRSAQLEEDERRQHEAGRPTLRLNCDNDVDVVMRFSKAV